MSQSVSHVRLAPFSRRSFLHLSAAASAAAVFHPFTEAQHAARARGPVSQDAIMIDSNENPLGPTQAARDAVAAIIPQGGRYLDNLTDELTRTFPKLEGLNSDYLQAFPGSTGPLVGSVLGFTSP